MWWCLSVTVSRGVSYIPMSAWIELICCPTADGLFIGSQAFTSVAVRAVGFPGSTLMRRLRLSPGTRGGIED